MPRLSKHEGRSRSRRLQVARCWRRALIFAFAISLTACGPEQHHEGHGGHLFGMGRGAHLYGMHHVALPLMNRALRMGLRGNRPRGFRRACADDVAKLCPTAKTRREERECLRDKQTSLSADCRAALERRRDPNREH